MWTRNFHPAFSLIYSQTINSQVLFLLFFFAGFKAAFDAYQPTV